MRIPCSPHSYAAFLLGTLVFHATLGWGQPAMSVKDRLAVKWVSQLTLAPKGEWAAFVLKSSNYDKNKNYSNIYLVSTQHSPGQLRQLTNTEQMNASPAFSPDGQRLAFVSNRGSGESQIWLIPLDGGEAVQLTRLSTGASAPCWSPDGRYLAFTSEVFPSCQNDACNAQRLKDQQQSKVQARVYDQLLFRHWNSWRDERRAHIFVLEIKKGRLRDMTPGPHDAPPLALGGSQDYVFSPDSASLAYVSNTDPQQAISTNNDVFEIPVRGGTARRLSQSKGNDNTPRYSPDGRYLAYLSMARAGYESDRPRLMVRNRRTGVEEEWSRDYDGQPLDLRWSPDSKTIYFIAPYHGQQEIYAASATGITQLSNGLFANNLNLTPDGQRFVLTNEAADRAPEVYVMDGQGKQARALTGVNAWLTSKLGLKPAEHVWFKGAKDDQIHAVLLKPAGFRPDQRYPAVLIIHGGPQGSTGNSFHPRWNLQMFARRSYVVFGIDFHGSIGYGQSFTDSITGDWGGKPYQDILLGVQYLAKQPFIAPQKIAAAGASYGGYLVNWIATHNQRFRCLISHAGVYNLESKYGSTEELWFPEWDMQGTAWSNRDLYRTLSPHSYAEKLSTPTLVIHGQRDYRVPVEQGFQLFTALQRQKIPSRLLYFPDEDHFVQKPQNIELWWKTMWGWLDRYLK